jgi:antitoxin component YwqK of YwqJK toxin-antitoxin module
MKYCLALISILLPALGLYAQSTDMFGNKVPPPANKVNAANRGDLNRTDEKGLKQGPWEKLYQNGRPAYKATFKDDKPIGLLTRFYTSGKTKVRIDYGETGEKGQAEILNESGNVIARGIYRNNLKDSTWLFYYASGPISAIEQYKMGVKDGKTTIFYTNGRVAEELTWVNGKKNGSWLQFYESGKIKMESFNTDDKIHGSYKYYFENGKQEINGLYFNGLEDGHWTIYSEDGKLSNSFEYEKGTLKNREVIEKKMQDQLLELEKNKDKLRDPEKLIDDPDAMMLLR